jgi:hypothetical protein
VPRTRTTKKLAQRIDLNYFRRRTPLGRWIFGLSVALPVLALLWLAWHGMYSDRRVYSAGRLSSAHAVMTWQCAACHTTQAGFFSENASDQKCITCHDGAIHHSAQTFTPSCASCHMEHRGPIRLAETSDAACTQCHTNLTTRGAPTKFERRIVSFAGDHPEFAVLREHRSDPGTIQLNHFRHMQPNLLGPGNTHVQMVCTDCHRSAADANGPWPYGDDASRRGASPPSPEPATANAASPDHAVLPASRAYMVPPTYARTCAACHTLQFDKRFTDEVPHDTAEKIHPFIVAKFQGYIASHPAELRVPRDPTRDIPAKPIPADYRVLTPAQWVAERTAEAEELLWRKTCKQCHIMVFSEGSPLPKVAPSNITARFMPHANFDHSQHGLVDCTACHSEALTSQQTTDLLLPGIATCRSCHHPGKEAAESRCFECHTYHDPAQHKPAHSNFSLTDVLTGTTPSSTTR